MLINVLIVISIQTLEHNQMALVDIDWSKETKEQVKEALQRQLMSSETDETDDDTANSAEKV